MSIIKYRDVVQDSAGNAIAGARVSILNTGTSTLRITTMREDEE